MNEWVSKLQQNSGERPLGGQEKQAYPAYSPWSWWDGDSQSAALLLICVPVPQHAVCCSPGFPEVDYFQAATQCIESPRAAGG